MDNKNELWSARLSTGSMFCKALVGCGYLTESQMLRAAWRYRLGRSRDGGVIFWQIDEAGRTRDGKIMYYREDCHRDKTRHPNWVSALLKRYYGYPYEVPVNRCLFGLHLLTLGPEPPTMNPCVAIVEAEKTAVIMSERFPQYLWMATGGLGNVQPERFRPLRGRRLVLFPDTDPDGTAFRRWHGATREVMRQPFWEGSPPVYVSPVLELRASAEQKARKIDIADYILET